MRLKFLPSFVKRRGRITKKQQENLKYLSSFSVKDINDIKNECSKFKLCCLEIGFGNSDNLCKQAIENPEIFFIGSEVYMSGIGSLIGNIKENSISNIKIFPDDIRILLDKNSEEIFDIVQILCPDPWPKDRHHKRRLINQDFLAMLNNSMKKNASLYISTDWKNYAENIKSAIEDSGFFKPTAKKFLKKYYLTKFEKRGQDQGREIFEFNYQKLFLKN